jgi:NADPH:quinone reductase-like Zn-dependent oxidoreductase
MKAAVHTRYGPPDVVRISDVEKPTARDNEVLVKVHATTVNRTDCGFRAAKPFIVRLFSGLIRPRVTVLGNEFAGVVEAVGTGVTSFEVGDRVFGYNEGPFGAHAEYMTIPEDGVLATMPANVTYEQAAPSTEGSHYALSFIRRAKIRSGQHVLVNGATGAIGSAAVQLLKSLGADVTATCDAENMELVRGLGADRVIDHTAEDFTKDDQTYDVVLDSVGKSSFGRCRRLLRPGGIYLSSKLGSAVPESDPGAHHSALRRQEGHVSRSEARPGDGEVSREIDRVRSVHAAHRQTVSVGPDRRGLQVRRDRAEDRQRRDHRPTLENVGWPDVDGQRGCRASRRFLR